MCFTIPEAKRRGTTELRRAVFLFVHCTCFFVHPKRVRIDKTEKKWKIWPVYIWKYRINSCCDNAILNDTEWTNALHVISVSTTDTSQPAHHWPLSGFILLLILVEGLRFYTGVNSFALFASHIRHNVKTKVKSKPNLLGYRVLLCFDWA